MVDAAPGASARGKVFTIPAGLSFVDCLARRLLTETGGDPVALARYRILLPTRRACRALQEAFLRESDGRALLLPLLVPLGDIDEEELLLGGELQPESGDADLPSLLAPLERQLLLAALVGRAAAARGRAMPPEQAASLAGALAQLIDQVETERLSFAKLAELVPADLAQHWGETVEFLKIATEGWPAIEREAGGIGPAARRNRLLEAEAARWRRDPPQDPVIVAGSTGSIPATAELIAAVAALPQGRILLAGLDRGDAEYWLAVRQDPSHPQHGPIRLLDRLGCPPEAVLPWPGAEPAPALALRSAFLAEALLPAPLTDRWTRKPSEAARQRLVTGLIGVDRIESGSAERIGLRRIDCANEQEEALAIALLLREAIEVEGRRAALVTPDRRLARRVTAELGRWNIEIDDSAGEPLSETPPGALLRLVAAAAVADAAPVPLLALLKHPLVAGGTSPGRFRARVRRLERAALRGPRPAPGLAGLEAALAAAGRVDARAVPPRAWFARLARAMQPFFALVASRRPIALAELVRAHALLAETLAASDDRTGRARLWAGDAGDAAARFIEELAGAARVAGPLAGRDYAALFETLMSRAAVRPRQGRHPRLFIWGLLEARLQQADLIVLGGLNEGSWPPEPAADPWMSRPMRERFGLPSPERRIGLAALDFALAAAAPLAVMTRAAKADGAPAVPARWLTRIDALLQAKGIPPATLDARRPYLAWAAALDRPAALDPERRPEPRPPVALRPRRLSVTEIGTWMRDPYAIYARHILKLRALDPLDQPPDAAQRGDAIHRALDRFIERYPATLPEDPLPALLAIGEAAFGELLDRPAIRAFWWPRFERIARWFTAARTAELAEIERSWSERRGQLVIEAPGGAFTLTAKADRIDRRRDGLLAVIDYKTGLLPKKSEILQGFAPQLPLEAAMLLAGGFEGIEPAAIAALAHWRLAGGDPAGEIEAVAEEPAAIAAAALAGLTELIRHFDRAETPYLPSPRADAAPRYSDYAHLARVKAWSAVGDAE